MNYTKRCTKCQEEFPATLEFFHKKGDGLRSRCKKCINKQIRTTRNKNRPEKSDYTIPKTKKCSKCGDEYENNLEFFYKCSQKRDNLRPECKKCTNAHHKEYRKNPEVKHRRNHAIKTWAKNNEERSSQIKKQHYENNKSKYIEKAKRWKKEKCNSDPSYKVLLSCRNRLSRIVREKDGSKPDSTLNIIGCSTNELKSNLEKQFVDGMNWENYGRYGWHVDHIRPCCSFDLTDPEQVKKCFHYTNLQPLWAEDNLSKGGRYEFPHNDE